MTKKTPPQIHNNTDMALEAIRRLPFLGRYENRWRQRWIDLYRFAFNQVISVGTSSNGTLTICAETDQDHCRALDAFKYGRTYTAL